MRRGGVDIAIWAVIAIAILFVFFLVREARADEPKDNLKAGRIEQLEHELAVLKAAKGCAKLEVTEPPRWTPKKERDS